MDRVELGPRTCADPSYQFLGAIPLKIDPDHCLRDAILPGGTGSCDSRRFTISDTNHAPPIEITTCVVHMLFHFISSFSHYPNFT